MLIPLGAGNEKILKSPQVADKPTPSRFWLRMQTEALSWRKYFPHTIYSEKVIIFFSDGFGLSIRVVAFQFRPEDLICWFILFS